MKITFRFRTLMVVGWVCIAMTCTPCRLKADDANSPPNIVLIVTDDQGYADVGFNGCTDIPTPNLDRIANEGVRCTNGYVSYSVCGPSRAGLMTGRYQGRFGFTTNPTIDPGNPRSGIPLSETMLSEALQKHGYTNMIVGKWHLGTHPTLRPLKRGFDEFFGFLSGGHDYFPERYQLNDLSDVRKPWDWYRTKLLHNDKRVTVDQYLTDELSARAVEFIKRSKDRSFFLYLAYNAPHTPLQATQKYLDRFGHIENDKRRKYAAMVSAVDDGVGNVLNTLDELKLAENTIVFFLSDNGGATNNASQNTPLRGHKGSFFEGGLRVPFAIRYPRKIQAGGDYDAIVSALDIFPTTLSLAGGELTKRELDGVDLLPFLTGAKQGTPHECLAWRNHSKGMFAIRNGDQKLVVNPKGKTNQLLFDLGQDKSEKKNLLKSQSNQQISANLESLSRQLDQFKSQLKGPAFPALGTWLQKPKQRKK